MSKAPGDWEPGPDEGGDLRPIDQALLLAIGRHKRGVVPLTLDQDRLLDDWVAGRLPPADAERAAELTKSNSFAAERVLERRLIEAANSGPGVPPALTARVLAAARPIETQPSKSWFRLPSFSGLQWSMAGAAVAAMLAVAVFSLQLVQERRSDQRIQVAMVTFDDRSPLSRPIQRSLGNQPTATTESVSRDLDVPADVLRRALAGTGADRAAAAAQLLTYLPAPPNAAGKSVQILIDSALNDRLAVDWRTRAVVPIRVYDLDDTRTTPIRNAIKVPATAGILMLLTVRP